MLTRFAAAAQPRAADATLVPATAPACHGTLMNGAAILFHVYVILSAAGFDDDKGMMNTARHSTFIDECTAPEGQRIVLVRVAGSSIVHLGCMDCNIGRRVQRGCRSSESTQFGHTLDHDVDIQPCWWPCRSGTPHSGGRWAASPICCAPARLVLFGMHGKASEADHDRPCQRGLVDLRLPSRGRCARRAGVAVQLLALAAGARFGRPPAGRRRWSSAEFPHLVGLGIVTATGPLRPLVLTGMNTPASALAERPRHRWPMAAPAAAHR